MKLTDKQFWIWETILTLALSILPWRMYGEIIFVILLIVISYAIVGAIGLRFSSKISLVATWILIFCATNGVYIIDLITIDTLRLIKMESYPLIVGQIYLFPICFLANTIICITGYIVSCRTNKMQKVGE